MKNNESIEFGKRITDLRTQRNMTQDQVTAKMQTLGCNISRGTYAKLEVGIRNVRISELKCLKEIFNVSFDDLLY